MTRCGQVGTLAVGEQIERLSEGAGDVAEGGLGSFQVALGLPGLGGEAVLLRAQKIDRHRARVVGVEELLALLIHLRQPPPLASGLGFGLLAHSDECHLKLRSHEVGLLAFDDDVAVGVLDRRLDQIDRHVGLLAAGALHSADAEEVGVAAAVALRLDQAHARTAATAVEGALQVVVVLAVLLGGMVVGGEDRLGFVEARLVDQVLVSSLVLHSRVADDPHVVGVLEHQGELASRERLFGLLRGRPRPQAALGQSGQERVEGVGAGAVGGEGPADVGRPLGIDFDRANFAPLDQLADIQVAERCPRRRASHLRLLDQSLLRLGREVGRVELGVGGDDRVHEGADRGAVDVLGDRDKIDVGFVQRVGDGGVVVAVAGETINLVDDHVVEVAIGFQAS